MVSRWTLAPRHPATVTDRHLVELRLVSDILLPNHLDRVERNLNRTVERPPEGVHPLLVLPPALLKLPLPGTEKGDVLHPDLARAAVLADMLERKLERLCDGRPCGGGAVLLGGVDWVDAANVVEVEPPQLD